MRFRPRKAFARTAVSVLLAMAGTACADGDPVAPREEQQPPNPSAGPDPDQILFLRHADGNSTTSHRLTDIYRMNADGTGVRDLTAHPAAYGSLSVSPDGSRVAFASSRSGRSQVWVMNTDGSGLTQLTNMYDAGAPRWSPDGSLIAFQGQESDYRVHVWVMNPDGSNRRNLSRPSIGCGEADGPTRIELIGWMPDGRVAFHRWVCGGEGYRFYTVNPDGSGFARTDFDLNDAWWSPDGSKVAVNRWYGPDAGVYVMNADGSGARRLGGDATRGLPERVFPQSRSDYTPWSPDGTRIVFQSGSASACRSHVANVDGSGLRQLSDLPCSELAFSGWSPAGDRLAFTGWKDGRFDVYTMKSDGTGLVKLTNSIVPLGSPMWLPRR